GPAPGPLRAWGSRPSAALAGRPNLESRGGLWEGNDRSEYGTEITKSQVRLVAARPASPGDCPRPWPCFLSCDSVGWSLVTQRGEQAGVGFLLAPRAPNPPYSSSPKGETYDENNTFEAKGLR